MVAEDLRRALMSTPWRRIDPVRRRALERVNELFNDGTTLKPPASRSTPEAWLSSTVSIRRSLKRMGES